MVRVTDTEIAALTRHLELTEPEFRERYTRPFDHGITLLKEQPNFDCTFYDRKRGCTVYEARPTQCRAWPFWEINVSSARAWTEAAVKCPGINHGPHHSEQFIAETSRSDGTCGAELREVEKQQRERVTGQTNAAAAS
jgi:hypothetical protein